ncbi:MAG: DUF3341 domain-containing protein [Bdellovibrionales bacterium]|jgi:hypothetical protein|nr:DUF3341 domain-containing protein [Bdellovibrionales bacterium]
MAKKSGGIAGLWLDDHECVEAARKVREAGFKKFDAVTPFPVHGMEEAIGIKRSPIPYVTFVAGVTGLCAAIALQVWTSAVSWPLNVGGKPFISGPAFVPVMFELTVLFAALLSVGALFALCRLPKVDPPVIDPDVTCHKFAIFISEEDAGYNAERCEQLLKSLGAKEIKHLAHY